MNPSDRFVCKPTSWLPIRATAIFLLFGTFAWLFYHDGSVGYRRKNAAFFLHQTFKAAAEEFALQNRTDSLTAGQWKKYASRQTVKFPDDPSVLPPELPRPMPWPAVLQDFERMKKLQPTLLWTEFTASWEPWKMAAEPPEHAFDARKIQEQWVVGACCAALALMGLLVLLRTLKRSIAVDGEAIYTQSGRRVPFSDLIRLDLRKWDTKGLAVAHYKGGSGTGRIRIDGLIYGGFDKEKGEPAEELLRRVKARFSGELVAYGDAFEADSTTSNQTE